MQTLNENAIRPEHLMTEQARLFQEDVARLVSQKDLFLRVACPACGADDPQSLFQKYEIDFQNCPHCETTYVSPRPSPALLGEFYSQSKHYAYWNEFIFPASEDVRRNQIFRPRVDRVRALMQKYECATERFVEVGAGFGTFCEELSKARLFERILAIEPTPGLAATCRGKGIEVLERTIESIGPHEISADFVASFEVIEHLFSPREYLRICRDFLNPGGLLLVTCPSCRGFDVLTLGPASSTYDAEHLNYFHPESLALLVSQCGFDVLETSTPGQLDADIVRRRVLKGELDLKGQPFLQRVLVEEWETKGQAFQDFLSNNNLSSHLWLLARRSVDH